MELEGLLEQDLVLHAPLVWEGGEVRQILQCSEEDKIGVSGYSVSVAVTLPVEVMFVPEEHSQRLFCVVPVLLLGNLDELVH